MSPFLKPWRIYASILLVTLAAGGGYLIGVRIEHGNSLSALEDQRKTIINSCITAQVKTSEVDNGLQNDLKGIADKLAAGSVSTCVAVNPASPAGDTHPAGRDKHARQNGLSARWLREYAAEAETYRVKVIAFQKICQ